MMDLECVGVEPLVAEERKNTTKIIRSRISVSSANRETHTSFLVVLFGAMLIMMA
jgi:hypothetical protein